MNEQQAHEQIKRMMANGLRVTANTYYEILDMLMRGRKTPVTYTTYTSTRNQERQ